MDEKRTKEQELRRRLDESREYVEHYRHEESEYLAEAVSARYGGSERPLDDIERDIVASADSVAHWRRKLVENAMRYQDHLGALVDLTRLDGIMVGMDLLVRSGAITFLDDTYEQLCARRAELRAKLEA